MNYSFTTTILIASVCFSAYEAGSTPCETNGTAGCENGQSVYCLDMKGAHEIEKIIAKIPEIILIQTNNVFTYTRTICEKINRCADTKTRYRYFRNLMESACQVNLEKIDDRVPNGQKGMSNTNDVGRVCFGPGLCFDPGRKRLGETYDRLWKLADGIYTCLRRREDEPAPYAEQFEPFFKFIEKLKNEEKRLGISLHWQEIDAVFVERQFRSSYLEDPRKRPDPQDRALVEARFEQVVGRPMCSSEKYEAELRERMENDEKKQREKTMRRKKQGEQP